MKGSNFIGGGIIMPDFDPRNITNKEMKNLADHFEEYTDQFFSIMVIPREIIDKTKEPIENSRKLVSKLIKKLKEGDKNVFRDEDEWDII